MQYRCKCGYEGYCYGTPTMNGVSAPWCPKCERNNCLMPLPNSTQGVKVEVNDGA